jgi:hypothetical protein
MPKREVEQGNFFTNLFCSKSETVCSAMLTMRKNCVGAIPFFSQADKKLDKEILDCGIGSIQKPCWTKIKHSLAFKPSIKHMNKTSKPAQILTAEQMLQSKAQGGKIYFAQLPTGTDTFTCEKCGCKLYENIDASKMVPERLTCICGAVHQLPK